MSVSKSASKGTITTKLTKIGNSVGLILTKEMLARLNLSAGDSIFLIEVPGGFRMTPYDPAFEEQMALAHAVMKEDRDILRELAK